MNIFLLCITTLLFSFASTQNSLECTLGVRVYPLKYVGATTTMEFRLGLKSSCSDFDSYNFFLLPYNVNFGLSQNKHPKQVILQLFEKVYQFNFTAPKPEGKLNYFNINYQFVTIRPSKNRRSIFTFAPNNQLLMTDSVSLFSRENISTLMYKHNPCICELSASRNTMFCKIN